MPTMINNEINHAAVDAQAATLMELDAFIDAGLIAARAAASVPIVVPQRRMPVPEPTLETFAVTETAPVAVAVAAEIDPRAGRKLDGLLRMADTYRASGALRQAMEMYYELAASYFDAPQGRDSEDRLLDIARNYERAGELRQARAIYERLL
jgi:hypothetical protein